ncbi:Phytanoyl-CoA dioxygenase [Macrophomina phaseolina MS6]|uniref:Phytanoyl-CoA dioxygenase n=1 Tax=Macrophomina phaseolina (strain MS6) TaxID=1126212 RepID=K2RD12_MACPH|nr:Phytanoyl-CoA dioxygenase [Macrophomina phaseolina MS6]
MFADLARTDKRVTFAETHMGPAGESTGEHTKNGNEPPKHKPVARSLAQFQDVLAKTYEDFRRMEVRSEEDVARKLPTDGEAMREAARDMVKLGGQRTGLALMGMLLAEFGSAVEGEAASQGEHHNRERDCHESRRK